MPKVSVLMSVLNGAEFLRPAVESVLNQTFTDFEFIVIDNASVDQTAAILDSYQDGRIVRVHNERTVSLTQSLNKGLQLARGDYIARLDADDVAMPMRFERQVDFLEAHPRALLTGTHARIIDETGTAISQFSPLPDPKSLYDALAFSNPFAHSSVMFRRQPALDLGGYPETYVYAQDLALWLKLAHRGELGMIPEFLIDLREHRNQATQSRDLAIARHREMISIFDMAQQMSGLSSDARRRGRLKLAALHCRLGEALLSSGQFPSAAREMVHGVSLAPLFCIKRALAGRRPGALPA